MVPRLLTRRTARGKENGGSASSMLPGRPDGVQLRARRSPHLILIGVLCSCLGALTMAWAWMQGHETVEVVVTVHNVSKGQKINQEDLAVTTIGAAPAVATVTEEAMAGLIGQHAQVDLPAGSLVGPQSIGDAMVVPGQAQVGLRLVAGRLPNQPLPPGTPVVLVALPATIEEAGIPGTQVDAEVVTTPVAMSDGQTWLVDVRVEEGLASTVAALSAAERLALIRKAEG